MGSDADLFLSGWGEKGGDGFGYFREADAAVVGFDVQPVRRTGAYGFGLKVTAEAEVESGGKQLTGCRRVAAEAVNRPLDVRVQFFVEAQQFGLGLYAMNDEGFVKPLSQQGLFSEDVLLQSEVAAQAVEPAFAYGRHLGAAGELFERLKPAVDGCTGHDVPRVDAGRIIEAGTRFPTVGRVKHMGRQVDGGAGGSV